jgi:lambda repressor-like predicted transcriptional regulator
MTTIRTLPDHGTLSRYKHHGCKCDTCRAGYCAYQRTSRRRRGYGTWQPFVDAEPIRQHILTLHGSGMSYASIAKAAGLYEATVTGFIYKLSRKDPLKKRATPAIAAKILAVKADPLLSGRVDATGARRRIQALAANGWPMASLAEAIGVSPDTVNRITRQRSVYVATARSVADVFERYSNEAPQNHGVPQWKVDRTRNEAQTKRWPDPVWWEDMGHIDDPNFDPNDAEKRLGRNELAALRRAEVEHLASFGFNAEEIDDRVDLALSTIRAILAELRTGQRRDRTKAAA